MVEVVAGGGVVKHMMQGETRGRKVYGRMRGEERKSLEGQTKAEDV